MNTSTDKLSVASQTPGQLAFNRNFLYMNTGGLYERGGGALLSENPNYAVTPADPIFSLGNYINASGSEYLLTNQDDKAYYYSTGWNDLGVTLTPDLRMTWEGAGYSTDRSAYGTNGTDRLVKVYMSGGVPIAKLVTTANSFLYDSPVMDGTKQHKDRLFGFKDDNLFFSEILDFDSFPPENQVQVAPGEAGFIKSVEIWGDAIFIFKEDGIWVLPNASDPDPVASWVFLRCDAVTGTQSPDSVHRTKMGIIFFASDNVFRLVNPNISYSSGNYSLGGSGSPIISVDIEDDLINKLSSAKKYRMQSHILGDLYIATFQSVDNTGDYNDLCYFCDTGKRNRYPNVDTYQPYWGTFTGLNFDFITNQTLSGRVRLYGANGITGAVQECLNDDIHNDAGVAIDSFATLAWLPIAGESLYKKVQHIFFVGDTESWKIYLNYNMYVLGELLPEYGEGINETYSTTTASGIGVVDTAVVGTAVVGQIGVGSEKQRIALKGYYFTVNFGNPNIDEFIRINKFIIYFRPIRNK